MNTQKSKNSHSKNAREIICLPIDENIISIRGLSPKRLRFAIEYSLEKGTTTNSFLFKQDINHENNDPTPTVLVHPPGDAFSDVFLPELERILPNKAIELILIVGHVNPNRIGLLRKLSRIYCNLKMISSNPGAKLIHELWNQQNPNKQTKAENNSINMEHIAIPSIQIIKKETTISLGQEYKLRLISVPTARWPGGLIVFEESLGILMSDKFFGAHICTTNWAETTRETLEEERRHYFDSLMAPMASQVDSLIEKLEGLEIRTIAPGHGPAIENSWRSLFNNYRRWGEGSSQEKITVVLLFASAYGNTAAIGDALANGINRTGVRVQSLNCEFTSTNELITAIKTADAYLIGSPTLGGHAPTPIISALGTLLSEGKKSNPVGIFGSYGWSGEALDLLENKLQDEGFEFGFDPIKVKFSPDAQMVKTIEETGTLFARKLLNKQKRQQRRISGSISANRSDPRILALGRVVGALCILTIRKGENENYLSGAMVASWVSQASFSPPGLSIAVAKDRAVEVLLHQKDIFTLNVLSQGKEHELMKTFLKPFPPGSDRLAGLNLETSPNNQPILPKALAWLECSISQRMECGDHWLLYAEVNFGKVLDQNGTTAIHHRNTGANY